MSAKQLIIVFFLLLTILSIASIYYRYIVLGDFEYETVDISEVEE